MDTPEEILVTLTGKGDPSELKEHLASLKGCCLREAFELEDILFCEAFYPALEEGEGWALWYTKSKTWGVLNESRDYTGHG
jgi:hypothetical protein